MKKYLFLIIAAFALAGCGKTESDPNANIVQDLSMLADDRGEGFGSCCWVRTIGQDIDFVCLNVLHFFDDYSMRSRVTINGRDYKDLTLDGTYSIEGGKIRFKVSGEIDGEYYFALHENYEGRFLHLLHTVNGDIVVFKKALSEDYPPYR